AAAAAAAAAASSLSSRLASSTSGWNSWRIALRGRRTVSPIAPRLLSDGRRGGGPSFSSCSFIRPTRTALSPRGGVFSSPSVLWARILWIWLSSPWVTSSSPSAGSSTRLASAPRPRPAKSS
ncbi:hypothetical protein PFISCL1PPCAC_7279, partial [Pristionchus fissidentatus]